MSKTKFRIALQALLNEHGKETGSGTPDFVLAKFLEDVLEAFDIATRRRTAFFDEGEPIPLPIKHLHD